MRESPQEKRVHELRRHVKRLRALARLLEQLGVRNASDVNAALGSLGRELSDERDLTVRNAWLAKNGFPNLLQPAPRTSALGKLPQAVAREGKKLRHEARLVNLQPERLEKAYRETLRREQKARRKAQRTRDADHFHRWRKRVRDLVEQGKLLGLTESPALKRTVKHLGKAQDTVVVREGLRHLPRAKAARKKAKAEGKARRKLALREATPAPERVTPRHRAHLQKFLRANAAPKRAAA